MRHTQAHSVRRRRSGNALLDLAFVLPILLMLTFGAVEYGYALYIKHALQGAAREGARAAIVAGATAASVQAEIDKSMQISGFPQTKYTRPSVITPAGWLTAAAGTTITVEVQTTWGTAGVHVLPTAMGGIDVAKVLKGATTMRKEG
jgi:Flp pilus assembly protein TadG